MQKRRRGAGLLLRKLLIWAICTIALGGLLSVHVFHSARVPKFSDPFRLPKPSITQINSEQSWTTEYVPPHPHETRQLNGSSGIPKTDKWRKPPANRNIFPCVEPSPNYSAVVQSRGYLLVHANGGLNQMRAGICDMVATARIINATLVVPELDKQSFWRDSSNFSDVFDVDHFINALANDVKIVKKLPTELANAPRANVEFKSWSGIDYYEGDIAKIWEEYQVIRAAKSDSRLVNNNLPQDIQKLRCRTCYEALRFAPHIEAMGKLLVDRMRSYGRYISLHLRYEKDVLAFSGCTYGLSPDEAEELKIIREKTGHWRDKDIDSNQQRSKGHCPLIPKEVGIFLTALGYRSSTPIYIASGEIYGGDSRMADLRSRYPMLMSKEKLTSVEELEPFINHATQMAALDYIVSVKSDIFIPTYDGNMARLVEGHRRYEGHRITISPDRKELVRLFDKIELGTLKEGKNLSKMVIFFHKKSQCALPKRSPGNTSDLLEIENLLLRLRKGSPHKRKGPVSGTKGMDRFRSEETFYANPYPDCLCHKESPILNTSIAIQTLQ